MFGWKMTTERVKDIYLPSCSMLYFENLNITFLKIRLFYYFSEFLIPWTS